MFKRRTQETARPEPTRDLDSTERMFVGAVRDLIRLRIDRETGVLTPASETYMFERSRIKYMLGVDFVRRLDRILAEIDIHELNLMLRPYHWAKSVALWDRVNHDKSQAAILAASDIQTRPSDAPPSAPDHKVGQTVLCTALNPCTPHKRFFAAQREAYLAPPVSRFSPRNRRR